MANLIDRVNDLAAAVRNKLNTKQATLVSGTNIKTVNGNSLLGSGDLSISGGGGGGLTNTQVQARARLA